MSMIQLKLKLNSKKPTTVYAVNGKSYLLNPGSNVLNLEYEDYLSLAKALGIKPVDNKKNDNVSQEKEEKQEVKSAQKEEPAKEEAKAEPEEVEDKKPEVKEESHIKETVTEPENVEEHKEDEASEDNIDSESVEESTSEDVDYSSWTLKQLKAMYKKITGENCKLKKDDVISFLQEHQSND